MMPELCLDYQRTVYGRAWVRALLLAAGVLAAATVLVYQWRLGQEIAQREIEVGKMRHEMRTRTVPLKVSGTPKQLEEEIRRAKGVIEQLTLPWDQMFAAIESSDARGIALLSIQPDAEKRRISIGGEAKDLIVVLDYVRRLDLSGALAKVHLKSHEVQQQDPQRPVRFLLEATWAVKS